MADNSDSKISLQEAFQRFKLRRQEELAVLNSDAKRIRCARKLRHKMIARCRGYIGTPYKKKYHQPGSEAYESPLFLDCCGLIRRVMRDLRHEFGFRIGPWNQSYMFDTLPLVVDDAAHMEPGDLVFVTGRYYNEKARRQLHDVVHVEVWLGDCDKTIGARWHNGTVQVFDSYKFESKSYGNMRYHLRSIETWLNGVCRSFCPQHPWKVTSQLKPSNKSIFYCDVTPDSDVEDASDEDSSPQDVAPSNTDYDVIVKSIVDTAVCCALAEIHREQLL